MLESIDFDLEKKYWKKYLLGYSWNTDEFYTKI